MRYSHGWLHRPRPTPLSCTPPDSPKGAQREVSSSPVAHVPPVEIPETPEAFDSFDAFGPLGQPLLLQHLLPEEPILETDGTRPHLAFPPPPLIASPQVSSPQVFQHSPPQTLSQLGAQQQS